MEAVPGPQRADLEGVSYAPTGRSWPRHDVAAGDAGRGAELDYRFTWVWDSVFMLRRWTGWALTGRRSSTGGSSWTWSRPADLIAGSSCRSRTVIGGARDGYRADRSLCRVARARRSGWQTVPGTSSSTTCWGRLLDTLDVEFARRAIVGAVGGAGRVRGRSPWRTGGSPTRASGGVRGDRSFTPLKVRCGCGRRGADTAAQPGADERAHRRRAGAEEIKAEILDKGVSDRGVFRGSITRPMTWMPRCCCCPIRGSRRRTTSASRPPCWPSPMS